MCYTNFPSIADAALADRWIPATRAGMTLSRFGNEGLDFLDLKNLVVMAIRRNMR